MDFGTIFGPILEPFWPHFGDHACPGFDFWAKKGAPQGSQNGAKIAPKSVPKSFQNPCDILSRFWTNLGGILAPKNGDIFVTFSRFLKKSQKFVDMRFLTTFPCFSSTFEGPRASNFKKNESRDPFGMGHLFD